MSVDRYVAVWSVGSVTRALGPLNSWEVAQRTRDFLFDVYRVDSVELVQAGFPPVPGDS